MKTALNFTKKLVMYTIGTVVLAAQLAVIALGLFITALFLFQF